MTKLKKEDRANILLKTMKAHILKKIIKKQNKGEKRKMSKIEVSFVKIDKINPYDKAHPPGYEYSDAFHRTGIDYIKKVIREEGHEDIYPILVQPTEDGTFQRKDGFKRYFAFKELGFGTIQCFVNENAKRGGQSKKPLFYKNMERE